MDHQDKLKELLKAIVEKKPLEVKEHVNDLLTAKAAALINESQIVFSAEDHETQKPITDEEIEEFFEWFQAEYGHLPEEEQMALMKEYEAELFEENPNPPTDVTNIGEPLAGEHKPHLKPEGSSPGGIYDTSSMTKKKIEKKEKFTKEKTND